MDERVMQFRVGVMFLATLLITATLLVMFGKLPRLMSHYPIYIRFDYAGGITKGTPIRKSGVLIGEVSAVKLIDGDSRVLVTADIQADKKIYKNEDCYINREQLVMGDSSLAFIPDPRKEGAGEVVVPGTELIGRISDDPTGLKTALQSPMDTAKETGIALRDAADELKRAARNVDNILNDERQTIHDVLANASESLKAIKNVLGDQETQEKLAAAMKRLPDTLDGMNETFETANKSLQKFSQRSGTDNRTAVERMINTVEMTERMLRKFSEAPPGELAPADQVAKAMADIGEITGLMKSVIGRIENGDGTLGALMTDRQLYDRLNRAARNIDELTQKMKPVIDDARVISDKVARHPGTIIRDAIKPGPGIK
jgi:phospholipid/cholesterol/gamma-HCH transport system substrate-binding protein